MSGNESYSNVPVGKVQLWVIIALSFLVVAWNGLFWFAVYAPPKVVHVVGTGAPRAVQVGRIPDALARDFVVDFLVSFENYSPETVQAAATFSRSRVAPGVLSDFTRLLEERQKLVRQSGMVSQILVEDRAASQVIRNEENPAIDVVVIARRRIYIAGRLTEEARVVYRLAVEPGEPTRANPTGLLVSGQSVKVAPKSPGEPRGGRREG